MSRDPAKADAEGCLWCLRAQVVDLMISIEQGLALFRRGYRWSRPVKGIVAVHVLVIGERITRLDRRISAGAQDERRPDGMRET